jgi:hypothetical protein
MFLSRIVTRLRLLVRFKCKYWARRLRGGAFPTVAFYPELPWARAAVFKICHVLGLPMTRSLDRADLVVHWEDVTRRPARPELARAAARRPVLNVRCADISKRKVEEVHVAVFGYGIHIDPRAHHGACVRKSDANAAHDGVIVTCPSVSVDSGYVYQRVIDNTTADGYVRDIRVPIFGTIIPFCYVKRRPLEQRFSKDNTTVELVSADAVLSSDEQAHVLRFSAEMGLDYGELDVLRDNGDGRIYVVDVNNTPDGPPNHLPPAVADAAIERMAATFERVFLA